MLIKLLIDVAIIGLKVYSRDFDCCDATTRARRNLPVALVIVLFKIVVDTRDLFPKYAEHSGV